MKGDKDDKTISREQGKANEQKIHGMAPFEHENEPYARSEPRQTENILKKDASLHNSIQLLAYQIYREKGGAALDNWLEAERILKHSYKK